MGRFLLAVLLSLCCVGWAEAGFYDQLGTPVCLNVPQMPEGKCLFVKGISDLPDPCLAKMEAAMKAMEPFAFGTEVDPHDMSPGGTWMKTWAPARKLWDATKKDCWQSDPSSHR